MKILCEDECAVVKKEPGGKAWTLASGFLFLFMPKCAFCWAAYMSLFSSVGLVIHYQPWFLPVALLLFLAALLKLLIGAVRSQSYISFFLALAAGTLMIWRQPDPGPDPVKMIAIALMTMAVAGKKLLQLYREIKRRIFASQ